jgi:CRISPR-associated protein Cpf1
LHSQLIEASLEGVGLSTLDESIYQIRYSDRNGKQRKDAKYQLRKEIVAFLKRSEFSCADGFNALLEKGVIDIITAVFGEAIYEKSNDKKKIYECPDLLGLDYKTIIEKYFKGFFTYLANFNSNRSNLYKDDGKASRVATRCIDENLSRFFQNKQLADHEIIPANILNATQKLAFDTLSFSNYLNQKGIEDYNTLITQINSLTNRYNQDNNLIGKDKLPKLLELHKQILAKPSKESVLFFVDAIIEHPEELQQTLEDFMQQSDKKLKFVQYQIFQPLENFDLAGIRIKRGNLKKLSNTYLQNRSVLEHLLPTLNEEGKEEKGKENDDVVHLQQLQIALNAIPFQEIKDTFKPEYFHEGASAFSLFVKAMQSDVQAVKTSLEQYKNLIIDQLFAGSFAMNLVNPEKNIVVDELVMSRKTLIKGYLDQVLNIERMLNMFSLTKGQGENKKEIDVERDTDFYGLIDEFYKDYMPYKFYNTVRNFLTKKPFSQEKIKVNFENSSLLSGWGQSLDGKKDGLIFIKDNNYFLAITKQSLSKDDMDALFSNLSEENKGQWVHYDFQKPDNKNTPRLFIRSK